MASGITTAFWGMTINNYDETDLAMVQNGYPDYLREIVHTLEEGEEGTPHIQAWIKLQRQQRLSFVKKLFPRGHFTPLTSDVYIANTKKYAQKLDSTAVAAAVHKFNDPIHTLETVCRRVGQRVVDRQADYRDKRDDTAWDLIKTEVERDMVVEDFRYAKLFVSSTYKQMWKQFGVEMCIHFEHTHTHTHTRRKKPVAEGITDDDGEGDDASGSEDETESAEGTEGEDYEDSEGGTDEGYTESECDGSSEEDAQ